MEASVFFSLGEEIENRGFGNLHNKK